MNEQEWQTTNDARAMLRSMRGPAETHRSRWFVWMATRPSGISIRKAIQFICGSIRDQGSLIWGQPPHNKLLEFCEDWADSPDPSDVAALRRAYPPMLAAQALDLLQLMRAVSADALMLYWLPDSQDTQRHADLLRELFGNPFEPCVIDPAWLRAQAGLVTKVAHDLYERRALDELPILADALEEVGCTRVSLLDHLRHVGPHRRGCWALDLVLGLE